MRPSGFSIARFFGISLVLALPGLVGLIALVLDDRLRPLPALAAGAAVFVGSGCVLAVFFRDVVRLSTFVERLSQSGRTPARTPPLRFELMRDFAAQIVRLDRDRQDRLRQAW